MRTTGGGAQAVAAAPPPMVSSAMATGQAPQVQASAAETGRSPQVQAGPVIGYSNVADGVDGLVSTPSKSGGGTLLASPSVGSPPTSPTSCFMPAASPPSSTPRRSGHHVVASDGSVGTDEDSLKKAMRRQVRKNLDSSEGNLPVYQFSPFMVVSTTCGELRPVYGGVFTIGGNGKG